MQIESAQAAQEETKGNFGRAAATGSQAASQAKISKDVPDIKLEPKFISGLKSDVTDNIFFIDDRQVVYPSGHNIVIYDTEDRTQKIFPCIEGTEGITAMAMSKNKKYLAVAEKSDKSPICSMYSVVPESTGSDEQRKSDTKTLRKKPRVICSNEISQQKAFVSMAFAPKNPQLLVTLTAEPEQSIHIWQWEKSRCFAMQTLMHSTGQPIGTQVSFSNLDSNVVLVTGNQTYKYYIHRDGNLIFQNKQISKKDYNMISQNYTAHCWLPEGKILVGTDQGQILLCDPNGEIKRPISTGSDFYIEKFLTYSKGFIIVGDKGRMKVFVNTGEPNNPYQEVASLPDPEAEEKMTEEQKEILRNLQSSRIKSLDLDSAEENLIFTTENNQLYRIGISLLDNKNIEAMYEYLVHPFHSRQISGMDVCIKKNLVVTCSADKTVKIWQYNQSTGELELQIN